MLKFLGLLNSKAEARPVIPAATGMGNQHDNETENQAIGFHTTCVTQCTHIDVTFFEPIVICSVITSRCRRQTPSYSIVAIYIA